MPDLNSVQFNKLFEVRILHEYYLNTDKNRSFFALDKPARDNHLESLIRNSRYDIWKDLAIEPTEATKKILQAYQMHFVNTKTGFFVGIKVKVDNNLLPFSDLPENLSLIFRIGITNKFFKNFTCLRLNSSVPSIYYFSNINDEGKKVFPSLSTPVETFKGTHKYEIGELSEIGGTIMEAIVRTSVTNIANWRKNTSVGLAHEGDRSLLPMQFQYKFDKSTNVKQANFTLKTLAGKTIKTIHGSNSMKLERIFLDFSVDGTPERNEIKEDFYLLEVNGDGLFEEKKIVLNKSYNSSDLGLIEINSTTGDSDFNLLETDGSLKSDIPVFEIRLKSRITYWRYKSDTGIKFKTTAKTSPYLGAANGALKSLHPIQMNAMPLEFIDENPLIASVFLPNPPNQSIRIESDGMIYSDIYLNIIKDLIIEDI